MSFDGLSCSEALFRSAEVTRITGMQQDMIRLWRSRGHLPQKEGRGAVYTATEVAEIMVRHDLSHYGVTPAKSASIAERCASNVIRIALLNHPTCCEAAGPREKVKALQQLHQASDALATLLSNCDKAHDFVVRRDSEEPELVSDISKVLDERRFKTAMVLNLQKCAEILVKRSTRPLFVCEYAGARGEDLIRAPLAKPSRS